MKLVSLWKIFDRSFTVFAALAILSGAACYGLLGQEAFFASLHEDLEVFALVLPKVTAALFIAGFIQVLLPRDKVARWLGERSGFKGMVLATGAGAVTPGGAMTSFPLVTALHEAGTGRGPLIAYLTSWSTLAFQRIFSWEVPLMGVEFAVVRFLASLPLPFIAGYISLLFPKDTPSEPSRDE
jgi:uncharacterized membrane protein YraQ (UPF0718 family)